MATTRLMPLHTGKGRTVGQAISDIIDYTENPQKTDGGRLITSWQCDSRIADAEFLFAKNQYTQKTGRVRGEDDVIAYHLRQSFVPGEITPEEANRLGCELAKRFTKGNHAYIVCTHIDKAHIHNHVIWNSTALSQTRKFRNFWGSSRAVRRLNDTICIENGYSMEKGYDTPTGENGNLLSGGERQRISIARAILKNSPILLLDEATASLDIENELAVKQAIANLLKEKKTVVMIAHTLSIVKNADQILVVSDGKIAEAGTHDELLAKGGKYAAMWNAEQKLSA